MEALLQGSVAPAAFRTIVAYYSFVTPRLEMYVREAKFMPPTLMLRGDADSRVTASYSSDLEAVVSAHGGIHEVHVYPGAEQAFNFHEARGYDPAAAKDAWERTLTFLDQNLK